MRAFVLSGGKNLGPLQVGALRALLENDIRPDMIVGCSAGALNAFYLLQNMVPEQMDRLADMWSQVTRRDIYPGNTLSAFWRFIRGRDSLFDNDNLYRFVQRQGANPELTFGELGDIPFYVTSTHLRTGRLHVFGHNPDEYILDALMASTALPPMHPPWTIQGEQYIDGSTTTPLPLRVAIEEGATEIYALHIQDRDDPSHNLDATGNVIEQVDTNVGIIQGVAGVVKHSISTMLGVQAKYDLMLANSLDQVELRYLSLCVDNPPSVTDFSQTERLVESGYEIAMAALPNRPRIRQPQPASKPFVWELPISHTAGAVVSPEAAMA